LSPMRFACLSSLSFVSISNLFLFQKLPVKLFIILGDDELWLIYVCTSHFTTVGLVTWFHFPEGSQLLDVGGFLRLKLVLMVKADRLKTRLVVKSYTQVFWLGLWRRLPSSENDICLLVLVHGCHFPLVSSST
jgi:hypothetical protein